MPSHHSPYRVLPITSTSTNVDIPGYDLLATYDAEGTSTYKVDATSQSLLVLACGASSGTCYNGGYAGEGGCIQTVIDVTPLEELTINVGGVGSDAAYDTLASGGFNGGGTIYDYME